MAQDSKLTNAADAVERLVRDGDLIMLTGEMDALPMALVRAVIRGGRRDLRVVGIPGNGLAGDMLIGAGAAVAAEVCHISLGSFGPAPNFKRLAEAGRLKVTENSCGIALSMAQAGAMGAPFLAVRGLYGSDLMTTRDDFKVIDDPYHPGEQVVVAPALRPDVFLTHGAVADRQGNVVTTGGGRNDLLAAQCARVTIVTVEAISEEPLTPASRPGWIYLPGFYVNAVVHAPWGSHPAEFHGLYPADVAHIRRYVEAARSDEGFRAYLDEFVTGPSDHDAYLERALDVAGARRGS